MDKFQKVICKLAETHPNGPLTPAARTFLLDRLSQFGSEYKTPDHPPYSAMIERAISELNEKRGSTEDSISRFLEKEYNNLPWAHSTILKHHLQNLCASSFIVLTHNKRYKLPSKIKFPITKEVNKSETEFPILNSLSKSKEINKTKPPRKRTRWRKHKRRLIKLKYKGKIVAVIGKNKEYDELDEVTLLQAKEDDVSTVRVVEQPGGQQSKKSPRFQSPCVDTTELSIEVNLKQQEIGNPDTTALPVEVNLKQQEIGNPDTTELPVEVNLKQQVIGLSEIMDHDVSAAHTQEQSEHTPPETSNPTDFELARVENLPNPELPSEVSLQQFEYSQPELPCLENLHDLDPLELPNEVNLLQQEIVPSEITKPDFSAAHRVQNLPNPAPTQLEPKELFDSERTCRQLRRWNKRRWKQSYSGPILSGVFNLETPRVSVVEQMQLEDDVESVREVVREVENDVKSVKGADPQVTPDADYTVPSQHYPISEPISSNPSNFSIRVSSQQQEIGSPDITYSRKRKMNSKQSKIIVTDEKESRQLSKEQGKEISQDKQPKPRKSLRLRSSKPEIINVDANHVISLIEPSKEKSVNQKPASKPMKRANGRVEAEKPSTQHVGRPQQGGELVKRGRGRPRR